MSIKVPIKINVNHEPIIGPPIPHPFLMGHGFAGHNLGGIGGFGGNFGGGIGGFGGYGKRR